ncbi:MAG: copper amine oxidase N-terminal domain-containing protein [Clostridiales bacterium]|jgi:hypothetical protein|nr:copper amine oxidase N-terminal domain-containing protein [Clostridiales bacterium]
MLKTGLLLLALTCQMVLSLSAVSGRGAVVSSVYRLDLSGGRIAGEKADYYLDVPTMWQGYLIADREKIVNRDTPLERLNFYYQPIDKNARPAPFLTLEIYDKSRYTPRTDFRKLLETEWYIFTVWIGDGETLNNPTDIAIFNVLAGNASDDPYLMGFIRLFPGDQKLYENTIWVNGGQLHAKAMADGNVTYLPIRDVCEQLGYKVGWIEKQKAVTLVKNDFYAILILNNLAANEGYNLVIERGCSYVSSLYFITKLKLGVEIDRRGNVLLYEML